MPQPSEEEGGADPVWRLGLESLLIRESQQGVRRLDEAVQMQGSGSPPDDKFVWSPGLEARLGICLEEEGEQSHQQAVPQLQLPLLAPNPIRTPAKAVPSPPKGRQRPAWAWGGLMQSMDQDEDYMLPMPPIEFEPPAAADQQSPRRGMVSSKSAASFFHEYDLGA